MSDNPLSGIETEVETEVATAVEAALPASVASVLEIIPQAVWETALNNWLGTHIRGTPVTEASQAWQHLSSVLPELKVFLDAELVKVGVQPISSSS